MEEEKKQKQSKTSKQNNKPQFENYNKYINYLCYNVVNEYYVYRNETVEIYQFVNLLLVIAILFCFTFMNKEINPKS